MKKTGLDRWYFDTTTCCLQKPSFSGSPYNLTVNDIPGFVPAVDSQYVVCERRKL